MLVANVRKGGGLAATAWGPDEGTRKLIADLLRKPLSEERSLMVLRALQLDYHEEYSAHDFPEIVLMQDLLRAGFRDLIQNAALGKYDPPNGQLDLPYEA